MTKHLLPILLVLVLFCQCKSNGNKEKSSNTTVVRKENKQIPPVMDTPLAAAEPVVVDMAVNNADAAMLYSSKEAEAKHTAARKKQVKPKNTKTAPVYGNFPEGSERKLQEWDVTHLSKWGYTLMINEIYARHNMIFTDPILAKHFKKAKWYRPKNKNVDKLLTAIEKENLAYLKSAEVANKER